MQIAMVVNGFFTFGILGRERFSREACSASIASARSVHLFCYPIQTRIVITFLTHSETSNEMLTGCRPLPFVLCLLAVLSIAISPASAEHKKRGPNGEPSISDQRKELRTKFQERFESAPNISLQEKYGKWIRRVDCDEHGDDTYDEVFAETKSKKEAREAEFMAVLRCYVGLGI